MSTLNQSYKEFGHKVAAANSLYRVFAHFRQKNGLAFKQLRYRRKCILDYLRGEFKEIMQNYKTKEIDYDNKSTFGNIWVFWLQGEENATEAVRMCIESMKKNANGHKVIVLDAKNYSEYITLPEHILEKYKKGIISNTHLSDVIRVNILCEYGGLWLDASVYVKEPIPEKVFQYAFFSKRHESPHKHLGPETQWIVGIMGGKPNLLYFLFARDCFEKYWKEHNATIDYFLFDYITDLFYTEFDEFKEQIRELDSRVNCNFYNVGSHMNEKYSKEAFERLTENTFLIKIPYKKELKRKDDNGNDTIYGYMLKMVEM